MSTTMKDGATQTDSKIQVELASHDLPKLEGAIIELIKAGLQSPNFPDYRDDLLTACDLLLAIKKSNE
ncbi:MAG: hypothetical protein KF803_08690 [Cyclobacteriaceae bacterium]|nr:hypothetical protein [Cyclobacteriaceae bacterium]